MTFLVNFLIQSNLKYYVNTCNGANKEANLNIKSKKELLFTSLKSNSLCLIKIYNTQKIKPY